MILFCVFLGFILIYIIIILLYVKGFSKTPEFHSKNTIRIVEASILISCRNPSENLKSLISQLESQIENRNNAELIIIDDFSNTEINCESERLNLKLLKVEDRFNQLSSKKNNKKEAIAYGVEIAKFENIICIDCDIVLSENWWFTISNFIAEKKPKFAAGIHRYLPSIGLLNKFLILEQDILTASSLASLQLRLPTMCNGANMIFSKAAFIAVNGYSGLYNTNGGDDIFLYHRIFDKYPRETHYIKSLNAAVYSESHENYRELMNQRRRWISKSPYYENRGIQIQSLIVLLSNIVTGTCIFYPPYWGFVFLKMICDVYFIGSILKFYKLNFSFYYYALFVFVYPIYVLNVLIFSIFTKIKKYN